MQGIRAVVFRQRVLCAIEREARVADPISVTPYQRAKVRRRRLLNVSGKGIESGDDVAKFAVAIRHLERYQNASIGDDPRFYALRIRQRVDVHRIALRRFAPPLVSDFCRRGASGQRATHKTENREHPADRNRPWFYWQHRFPPETQSAHLTR